MLVRKSPLCKKMYIVPKAKAAVIPRTQQMEEPKTF